MFIHNILALQLQQMNSIQPDLPQEICLRRLSCSLVGLTKIFLAGSLDVNGIIYISGHNCVARGVNVLFPVVIILSSLLVKDDFHYASSEMDNSIDPQHR